MNEENYKDAMMKPIFNGMSFMCGISFIIVIHNENELQRLPRIIDQCQ